MSDNAAYVQDEGITVARLLQRLGHWDDALTVLADRCPGAAGVRAEILVDRFWWRLDQAGPARDAVAALEPEDPVLAAFLAAQLAYARLVFGLDPGPDDRALAYEGFTTAASDDRLTGWATFWLGVLADNVDTDPRAAGARYERALAMARDARDALLESYAVRHQGAQLLEAGPQAGREAGLGLLRRSYYLRAALGARPQTAAAAATLADALPAGAEAGELRSAAALTARELRLTWLLDAL
jgi:hypothetical protein